MSGDPLWINASAGAPAYSANELRQAMSLVLMYDGRSVGARKGVRPGGTQLQVTLAGTVITVQPGVACLDPGLTTAQGPYWAAIPAAETPGPLTAADATNPRKDIVILRVYDHDEDASGLRLARTEYIAGVANPSPAEPAIPAGAIRLATIDVPASPGAAVVTNNGPFAVATGGILPVRAAADIAAAVKGRYRDRLDTNVLERDSGAAWETMADPNAFKAWDAWVPVWSSAATAVSLGNGTIIGRQKRIGETVHVLIRLTWGSTTTGGTGDWRFTLPADPNQSNLTLSGMARDESANFNYPVAARVGTFGGGTPNIPGMSAHTATGVIGNLAVAHPFVWANLDVLTIQGTYPVTA